MLAHIHPLRTLLATEKMRALGVASSEMPWALAVCSSQPDPKIFNRVAMLRLLVASVALISTDACGEDCLAALKQDSCLSLGGWKAVEGRLHTSSQFEYTL